MSDLFFTSSLILVFDLDNTLILRDEAMLHCIEQVFNVSLSDEQKEAIEKQDQKGHSDRMPFCHWLKPYLCIPLKVEAIWSLIRNNIGHFVKLNKDARIILKELQSNYELVLFTNGGVENQYRKIIQTGLDSFFAPDKIFISEALGVKKPDPKAFQIVQNQFGEDTRFCMIGDHWENDILGALNFGWQAVHLSLVIEETTNKNGRNISSLAELIPLLNELEYPD